MKILLSFITVSFLMFQLHAQKITITGTVSDEHGHSLPGANVIEKGTSNGTKTDFDGNYSIRANVGGVLVFSYVGYETTEKKIQKKSVKINASLPEGAELNEVVVTAMAIPRKKARTGYAVVRVEADQRSVSNALQGKVAGVQVTNANVAAGASPNLISAAKPYGTDNESYRRIEENNFKRVETSPLSTFSIDVDKAGYSNVRRMINNGQKVPEDAVKIEEMINYFSYEYPQPKGNDPFSITTEVAASPWNKDTKLIKIGLKGKDIRTENLPNSNLVFLLDVSGSMDSPNKLGLLKSALGVLVDQLREQDKVSIVVYAGAAGLVLKPTSGANKTVIMNAIENLSAGGSTAGGEGIQLAYKIAEDNFIKNGNNRVILATDGDFNVGASSDRAMENLIEEKRDSGVFLTCLGFGMGNYKDSKMETLADKGNGNHAYIDTMQEAKKVLGTEFFGTMYTIAKDVKIQVEFNPGKVQAYRLIGYENRLLNDEDFNDDKKDAGELGSGHTVTALYEIVPTGVKSAYVKEVDGLKYTNPKVAHSGNELLTVKFRYKEPDGTTSKLLARTLIDTNMLLRNTSPDFQFSAAVALFAQQLRGSELIESTTTQEVLRLAEAGRGKDVEGYRAEFIRLVKSYR